MAKIENNALNNGDGKTYIRLFSGRTFDYEKVCEQGDGSQISLTDIATHLSRIPRFLGGTMSFYSVAQHSVLTSILCEREHGLLAGAYGLLHDASEAFTGDFPTPLKQYLYNRTGVEINEILSHRMDAAIFERFGLTYPIPTEIDEVVHRADFSMFLTEGMQMVRNFKPTKYRDTIDLPATGITINPLAPQAAERNFMERFAFLKNKLGAKLKA